MPDQGGKGGGEGEGEREMGRERKRQRDREMEEEKQVKVNTRMIQSKPVDSFIRCDICSKNIQLALPHTVKKNVFFFSMASWCITIAFILRYKLLLITNTANNFV